MKRLICFLFFLLLVDQIWGGEIIFKDDFNNYPEGYHLHTGTFWNARDVYYGGAGLYWDNEITRDPSNPKWQITSGDIYVENGVAHSLGYEFRLNTVPAEFTDFVLKCRVKVVNIEGAQDWMGVRFFLRHDSQYRLYYIAPYRVDGTADCKKKLQLSWPEPPADEDDTRENGEIYGCNRGVYYWLTPVSGVPCPQFTVGEWHQVKIKVEGDPPTFDLWVDGEHIFQVKDEPSENHNQAQQDYDQGQLIQGLPITISSGALGIRGDSIEFYFDDFIVETIE